MASTSGMGEKILDLYMQNVLLGGKAGSTIAVLVGDGIKSAEALQCTDMVAPPVTATQHCNPWSHLFSLVHVGIQYPYDETMTSAGRRTSEGIAFQRCIAAVRGSTSSP